MTHVAKSLSLEQKNKRLLNSLLVVIMIMICLTAYSPELYRIFCQVTGYGGTTQASKTASTTVIDRMIEVRFTANTASSLNWRFHAEKNRTQIRLGETSEVNYIAENIGTQLSNGTATFNVSPLAAGRYFNKIACFCFTKQPLKPGERMPMKVTYFVDPDILNDPVLKNLPAITLSYTFFPSERPLHNEKNWPKARKPEDETHRIL